MAYLDNDGLWHNLADGKVIDGEIVAIGSD
jgi:hypothetical protein